MDTEGVLRDEDDRATPVATGSESLAVSSSLNSVTISSSSEPSQVSRSTSTGDENRLTGSLTIMLCGYLAESRSECQVYAQILDWIRG